MQETVLAVACKKHPKMRSKYVYDTEQ